MRNTAMDEELREGTTPRVPVGAYLASALAAANIPCDSGEDVDRLISEMGRVGLFITRQDRLRAGLAIAGFEPPDNVCASCGHHGGRHDLGNWCLDCPRPDDWNRTAKSPTGAKVAAGWCFFGSMSKDEQWEYGVAALRTALGEDQ